MRHPPPSSLLLPLLFLLPPPFLLLPSSSPLLPLITSLFRPSSANIPLPPSFHSSSSFIFLPILLPSHSIPFFLLDLFSCIIFPFFFPILSPSFLLSTTPSSRSFSFPSSFSQPLSLLPLSSSPSFSSSLFILHSSSSFGFFLSPAVHNLDQQPHRSEANSRAWAGGIRGPPVSQHQLPTSKAPTHHLTVSFAEPKLSASTSTSSALGSGPHSGSSGPYAMHPSVNFAGRPQQQQQQVYHHQQQQGQNLHFQHHAQMPPQLQPQHQQQHHHQQQHQHQQHQQPQQPQQQQQQPPGAYRSSGNAAVAIERLCQAASRGDIPLLNELLRTGTPLEADKEGRNAIHYASQNGHTTATRMLLDAGTEVDVEDNLGYTALHRAAAQGHRETVQLLISRRANINKQDNVHGNAALHEAAWNGYSQTVGMLCQARVQVNVINKANFTALHLAAQNGHNQSARVLLYAGCDSNAKNNYGDTALHTAARYGHAGVTRILISARARINETNKNGDTALHIAAALKRRKITKLMMEAGVDTEVRNKQQETALDVARRKAHAEIVHIILNTATAPPPANYHGGHHVPHAPGGWAHTGAGSIAMTNPTPGYQPLLMNAGPAPVYESMLTLGGSRMHIPAGPGPLPKPQNGDLNGETEERTERIRGGTMTSSVAPAPAINKKKSSIFGGLFSRKKKDKTEPVDKKGDQQQHPIANGVANVGVSAGQQPALHPALHPAFITTATGTQYYRDLAGNVRQGPVSYMPHTAISCGCLHHPGGHPTHLTHAASRPAATYHNPNDPSGATAPTWTAAPYHVPCVDHGYAEYHGRFQPPILEADFQGPRMIRSRSDESLSMSEHKAKCQEEKARQMALRELKAMRAAAKADGTDAKGPSAAPVQGRRAVSPSSYVPRISVSDAKLRPETTGQSAQPTQGSSVTQGNRHSDILSKMESIQRDYTRPREEERFRSGWLEFSAQPQKAEMSRWQQRSSHLESAKSAQHTNERRNAIPRRFTTPQSATTAAAPTVSAPSAAATPTTTITTTTTTTAATSAWPRQRSREASRDDGSAAGMVRQTGPTAGAAAARQTFSAGWGRERYPGSSLQTTATTATTAGASCQRQRPSYVH